MSYNGNVSFNETPSASQALASTVIVGTGLGAGLGLAKATGELVSSCLKAEPVVVPPTQFEMATEQVAKVIPWATIAVAIVTLVNAAINWLKWPVEQLKKGILWILRKLTALVNWLNPSNWFGGKKAAAQNAVADPAPADPVQTAVADPSPADPVQTAVADPVQTTADPVQTAVADPVQTTADPVQTTADPVQATAEPASSQAAYRGRKKHGR